MLYRCQACKHECERGWLPGTTCGLYLMFLLFVTLSLLLPLAPIVQQYWNPPPDAPPRPWWLTPALVVGGLVVIFFCAAILNSVLELIEYLIVRRKPCPNCGAKRWSWGFIRGFGL